MSKLCNVLLLSPRELAGLAAVFVLLLPAVTPRIYASDEIQYFAYLRSLWFDQDLSFENEYRYFHERGIGRGEGFHATFLELQTEAGRRPNFGTIGCALLWAPFYAVADAIVRMMRAAGADVVPDGFSKPYVAAVAYGSAFYGFVAVLLSIAVARRLLAGGPGPGAGSRGPGAAGQAGAPAARFGRGGVEANRAELLAGVLIWIGTPLLFYMYVAPPFSHATSAFAVAVFVTVWLHARRTWSVGGTIVLGLAGAAMAMVREQDAFFVLGPTADFVLTAARSSRAKRRNAGKAGGFLWPAAAGAAAFAVGFLPQLLAYWSVNGHPGPSKLVTRKMSWHGPHVLQVMGSPEHGFFFWTPLAVLAIIGLVIVACRADHDIRRIGACALLMVALQVYVAGSVESWTVAGAFGQRRFVALTVLLTVGLAAVLRTASTAKSRASSRTWWLAVPAIVAVCVWWNVALMALFGTRLMDRQQLQLGRNAYDAFVTLPRIMPELAYRYVTKRDSFYRSPHADRDSP